MFAEFGCDRGKAEKAFEMCKQKAQSAWGAFPLAVFYLDGRGRLLLHWAPYQGDKGKLLFAHPDSLAELVGEIARACDLEFRAPELNPQMSLNF